MLMHSRTYEKYVDDWLRQACPIFYFHSKEEFFPIAVSDIINHSHLWQHGTELFGTHALEKRFEIMSTIQQYDSNVYLDIQPHIFNGYLPKTYHHQVTQPMVTERQLQDAPIYTHCRPVNTDTWTEEEVELDLVYYIAYSNNGPQLRCWCVQTCGHKSDWECVIVRIKGNVRTGVAIFSRIYYNCHNQYDGQWVSSFEMKNNRPVVYTALYSHANYPSKGHWWWLFGALHDPCDEGHLWEPQLLIRLNEQNTPWIQYASGWTEELTCPLIQYNSLYRNLHHTTTDYSNPWYRRLLYPCLKLHTWSFMQSITAWIRPFKKISY